MESLFGAALGPSRTANQIFDPRLDAAKQVAVLAWIPIISILFGFAETTKIFFIATAAFDLSP
jgi:sulfonate transport system permease protein